MSREHVVKDLLRRIDHSHISVENALFEAFDKGSGKEPEAAPPPQESEGEADQTGDQAQEQESKPRRRKKSE